MLWGLFAKKVIRSGIQAALSYIGAAKLASWGVQVDPVALTAAVYAALEALRNVLKQKGGQKWL